MMTGCVVPHIERFEPFALEKQDPKTGEIHRIKLRTRFLDSEDEKQIADVKAILVITRGPAYLPDSRQGPSKYPKIVMCKFSQLDTLAFTDRELYVWPFFAVGTLHESSFVFIYKKGYRPQTFEPTAPFEFPDVIKMVRCPPEESVEEMANLASGSVREDRWREYVRADIRKRLE
jgi:hypothetical protein